MTTLTQRMNVVEENLQSIRLTLDTLLQNLLNPALMVPGTLRFGQNRIELSNDGMMIRTYGTNEYIQSIWWVTELGPNQPRNSDYLRIKGYIDAGYDSAMTLIANSADGDTGASVHIEANNATSKVKLQVGASDILIATDASVQAVRELVASTGITVHGLIACASVASPSQLTANQDNYNPWTGVGETIFRLSSDASRDITGIVPLVAGQMLFIFNVGGFNIVLKNDVTSTAANRFLFPADITLAPNEGIGLMYDETSSRWRCFGRY